MTGAGRTPDGPEVMRFVNPRAEEMRIRALYRGLVVRGGLRLHPRALRALVGPDCAYRLYRLAGRAGRE